MNLNKAVMMLGVLTLLFSACDKEEQEPFDQPFVHIMHQNVSQVTVSAKANVLGEYYVYLSSKPRSESLKVQYDLTVGEGLTEGVDYELLSSATELTFLPGIYRMPIRIRWMANALDPEAENSLVISLVANDGGLIMGLPGPDALQTELTITKVP